MPYLHSKIKLTRRRRNIQKTTLSTSVPLLQQCLNTGSLDYTTITSSAIYIICKSVQVVYSNHAGFLVSFSLLSCHRLHIMLINAHIPSYKQICTQRLSSNDVIEGRYIKFLNRFRRYSTRFTNCRKSNSDLLVF